MIAPEGYGVLGFATAFISYFLIIVSFGLDSYGTREISRDNSIISKLVNNVLTFRLMFALFCYLVLTVIVSQSGKPQIVKTVILITGISIFTNAISISWVFQGIEKMKFVAARQTVASLLTLAGVLLFVNQSNGIIAASIIISAAGIISSSGLILFYRRFLYPISFEIDFTYLKLILRESFPIALSGVMIAVYYNMDMIMMGYLRPEYETGIYSAAYKIFLISIIPFQLILNAFFPSLSRNNKDKTDSLKKTIAQYAYLMFAAGIISGIVLMVFAKYLILLIFGSGYLTAISPLSILSLNTAVISVNMTFGNPLLAWGKQKQYLIVITFGALTNVVLNYLLIPHYSYIGAAFATLLSEAVVFVGVAFYFFKFTRNI